MNKKKKTKKKNPNDVTFRNINAMKKKFAKIRKDMDELNKYLHTFGA